MKTRFGYGALIAAMTLAMLSGCYKPGPAEKAGKAVDNALDNAGRQIEKAGDNIKDAVTPDKKR